MFVIILHLGNGQIGGNILTPEGLQLMLKAHILINGLRPENVSYSNICYKYDFWNTWSKI